jgi:hypothetical protein
MTIKQLLEILKNPEATPNEKQEAMDQLKKRTLRGNNGENNTGG